MPSMAKRSDFAQKLLDDLRVRKERMAASQSSNRSSQMAIDAYSYAKQNYRGTSGTRTHEMIGSRTGNAHNRSSGNYRSSYVGEASNQIVTYGRGQSPQQIDLSMALAFALDNGGKLRRIDSSTRNSMLGFLQQIGRSSIDFGRSERKSLVIDRHRSSTSSFPAISHLQIEEISKGAQRLNQILRACSNGLNFDRYSIEIGKQLLKGATDLESSLKMLVNLQEASEYMINPRKKNQIKLLDDDEDDDEDDTMKVAEQWQLDLPRFSFDKPSRHRIQEPEKTGHKQRLLASNSTVGTKSNREKQAVITTRSDSHSRSFSSASDVKSISALTENKNQSRSLESKAEKGRIPNVIAKLMGLDELPESENLKPTTKKDSRSKQKNEGKALQQATQGSTKPAKLRTKSVENLALPKKQKIMDDNKNLEVQKTSSVMQREKYLPAHVSFEVVHDEKPHWKILSGIKGVTRSERLSSEKDKQETDVAQFKQNTANRMDNQQKERKQDNKKHGEQISTGKAETKELISKDMRPQMVAHAYNSSESAPTLQEKPGFNARMLQLEKNHADYPLPRNQKNSHYNLEYQQPFMVRKQEVEEEKKQREDEREQLNAKQTFPVRKQKGNELMSKSVSRPIHDSINVQKNHPQMNQAKQNRKSLKKPTNANQFEGFPNGKHHDDMVTDKSSAEFNIHMKDSMNWNSDQNLSPRESESVSGKEAHISPVVKEKPVQVAVAQKAKVTKVNKKESPRRIDEVATRRNGTVNNLARPLKHQSSILDEVKHRMHGKHSSYDGGEHVRARRHGEAESNRTRTSNQPLNSAKQVQKEATPLEDECKSLKEPQTSASNDTCQNAIPNDQQDQPPVNGGQELKCSIQALDELNVTGTQEATMDISNPSQQKHQRSTKSSKLELLTESENHLKQILVKSQLFLNTAEALFKLEISTGVLHYSGQGHQGEDSKLTLECGYELMRRTGRRQELIVHPCAKVSISFIKIETFDELVKKLHKDFEKLKFYGRSGREECEVEEYLPRMLQIDVHNKEPDLNSMWDLGWNETMFAFIETDEIIKDVEMHVLNGLLDEITIDLFFN
ncbi:uncharacterized protein LOC107420177 isoform X1 [Ziziphus jujuba]|uniref:Uncharacterized protein LOC107420177 isoform X1 n=2 Tax=Ziziphus jujuba TaxID=326968 RepID=A0ABM3ILI3_ZIZJJ|nr:uncharacterized protein LOC107420177 isoform X1 [Ziziphus jujuba]